MSVFSALGRERWLLPVTLLCAALACSADSLAAEQPLTLLQTIPMPDVPSGPYADHMAIDVPGKRLFTTPQALKAISVVDLEHGTVIRNIAGFSNPHAILYLAQSHRLFVTDSGAGVVVLDSRTYQQIRSIPLEPNADAMAYDSRSGRLYVGNGGDEAGKEYSMVSIIDTHSEKKLGDIRIPSPALEAMIVNEAQNRLYINMPESNSIGIVDLHTQALTDTWKLKRARRNEVFALDPEHHLLYVGCNEGDIRGALVVVDTEGGKELQRLPLGSWVDSMYYDTKRARIYASTGVGAVSTFERGPDGQIRALQPVDTAVMARTSLYSPELDRLFVMVPQLGWTSAKVLVFTPR